MNDSIWTIMSSLATVASVLVAVVFGYLQVRRPKPTTLARSDSASPLIPPSKSRSSGLLVGLILSVSLMVISLMVLVVTLTRASGAGATTGYLPTPTITLPSTITSSPTVLLPTATNAAPPSANSFQDSLAANTNGWAANTQCSFPGDGLHVNAAGGSGAYWCQAPFHAVSNASITVTARQTQGGSNLPFGIVFRAADGYHCYMFLITSGGQWAIDVVEGGQSIPLTLSSWTPTSAIHTGLNAENTLSVVANGSTFDLYINGVSISEQSDGRYGSGVTGLVAGSGAEATFTDLRITPS